MFTELKQINTRPEPFQYYTADELWTNEHTTRQMLHYHYSLEFAIVVLGFKEISQLVTSISISSILKQSSNEHFKFEELWNHSLLVGTGAKDICRQLGYPELGADAFVGGIELDKPVNADTITYR